MLDRPTAFDLTRLVLRLRHASPSGIDRVDLAYARAVLDRSGPAFGVISTAMGPRVVERGPALGLVEAVAAGWAEGREAASDPVYRDLALRLGSRNAVGRPDGSRAPEPADRATVERPGAAPIQTGHGSGRGGGSYRRRRIQARTVAGALARSRPVSALPRGSLYLNTSHMHWEDAARFDWLYERRDVRAAFFVHDLIPITHPEYGRAGEAERHAARMRTVGRHAAAILVNSAETGRAALEHLAAAGFPRPPLAVGHLGAEPAFGRDGPRFPVERPTFLVCGTIESRKNHLLLFQIWRTLAGRHGTAAPRLVVVGRRGWEAESALDMLERCPGLRAHAVEVSGLSTHGLAALMRSCTALLMPSFAEGYGIPIVEAAASGLPVVASDIPVHREVAQGIARFVDPLDGPGWLGAIEALAEPGSRLRRDLAERLAGYVPPSWPAHLAAVAPTLAAL